MAQHDEMDRLGGCEVEEVLDVGALHVIGDDGVEALELEGLRCGECGRPTQQQLAEPLGRQGAVGGHPSRHEHAVDRLAVDDGTAVERSRERRRHGEALDGVGTGDEEEPPAIRIRAAVAHPPRAALTTSLASACTTARCSGPRKDSA